MILNKKVGLIIPVRYHSSRLPGKCLMNINGKPNLERIIERALKSQYIDQIILALSLTDSKEIVNWFSKRYSKYTDIQIFIEDTTDLIKLCLRAAVYHDIDLIVDTSACCSLFDPMIADQLIERLINYNVDYSSNVVTRTFPDGFDVQVYTKEIYKKIESIIPKDHITRKWTGWNIFHYREEIYPKPRIINLETKPEYYFPEWRVTLDEEKDLELIRKVYEYFSPRMNFSYQEICTLLYAKKWFTLNQDVHPTKLLREKI